MTHRAVCTPRVARVAVRLTGLVGLVALSLSVAGGAATAGPPTSGRASASGPADVRPFPRQPLPAGPVLRWDFDTSAGWQATHACRLSVEDGVLRVEATGVDPYFHSPVLSQPVSGPVWVRLRLKTPHADRWQLFYTTEQSPRWCEEQSVRFLVPGGKEWHEVQLSVPFDGALRQLRLDPGNGPGRAEVDWVEVQPYRLHPLEVEQVTAGADTLHVRLRNHSAQPLSVTLEAARLTRVGGTVPAKGSTTLELRARPPARPFGCDRLRVLASDWPPLQRVVCWYRLDVPADWVEVKAGELRLRVARDGTGATLHRKDHLVAVLTPLLHCRGRVPALTARKTAGGVLVAGDGVRLTLALHDDQLRFSLRVSAASEPAAPGETPSLPGDNLWPADWEGPVVRVLGALEQGLFAGLEYLGRGEHSSSTLDIETADHLRFAPDPLKVTWPLLAVRTPTDTVALTWDDPSLRPVFATPNFLDAAPGHRLALQGRRVDGVLRVSSGSLEEAILWAVRRRGLPPVPPGRPRAEQWRLCLKALRGPLRNENGWGHCAEPKWPRRPYADMASTIFRLTGRVPELTELVPGGAHIRNPVAFFVTGRAEQWLRASRSRVEQLLRRQRADGSFRYRGRYQRGHFEDTASGWCAQHAVQLLEHAYYTGDERALQAGVQTLEYMKRFRTPRGAQVWELSLHTPDILASAHLVHAYVRGYQLTGRNDYLEQARRWALTGLPFVYLWSKYPVMLYATVPVYGATNWRAPLWIGRPVQWCGLNYAYALTLLAPYDRTLDWKHVARGILNAGEQMQYPDGPLAGCLPDSFELATQRRAGPSINPCALVSLRLRLEGELDSLDVVRTGGHVVVAPFPLSQKNGRVHVQSKAGLTYQVVVDGQKVLTLQGTGDDVLPEL